MTQQKAGRGLSGGVSSPTHPNRRAQEMALPAGNVGVRAYVKADSPSKQRFNFDGPANEGSLVGHRARPRFNTAPPINSQR